MARQHQEHKPFQFGTNPMQMSAFEKSKIELEREERKMATEKYINGIQGRDGGCKNEYDEVTTPFNTTK